MLVLSYISDLEFNCEFCNREWPKCIFYNFLFRYACRNCDRIPSRVENVCCQKTTRVTISWYHHLQCSCFCCILSKNETYIACVGKHHSILIHSSNIVNTCCIQDQYYVLCCMKQLLLHAWCTTPA